MEDGKVCGCVREREVYECVRVRVTRATGCVHIATKKEKRAPPLHRWESTTVKEIKKK